MLTGEEKETIINYNQKDKTANIYTCDPTLIKTLRKIASNHSVIIEEKQCGDGWEYKIPKKWIKVRAPRQLSEEKMRELADRARQNFHRQKNK